MYQPLQTNKASMYAVVYGQCTETMRAKLEGNIHFDTIKTKSDVIALLNLI